MSQPDTDTDTPAEDADDSNPPPEGLVYRVGNSSVYHTTDCRRLHSREKTMREAVAESWDSLSLCDHCNDDIRQPRERCGSVCDDCGIFASRLVPGSDKYLCHECFTQAKGDTEVDISWGHNR